MRVLFIALACAATLTACMSTEAPEGVEPVRDFDADRYLGRWYEIARLDHRFERGLSHVTAEYQRAPNDEGITVVNRGWDTDKNEWDEAVGTARFHGAEDVGHLEVSFFGPFYGGYVIVALDEDYQWSLVSGPNRDYLWILSRTPTLSQPIIDELVNRAEALDFPVDELIMVAQENRPEE